MLSVISITIFFIPYFFKLPSKWIISLLFGELSIISLLFGVSIPNPANTVLTESAIVVIIVVVMIVELY